MADGKDTIINTNADSIILRKGSSYNTLFKISETSTSLGYGSHSIGLNTISIGSNAASLEESPIEESQIMDGKLVVKNVNRSVGDINEIVIPVPPETDFLFNKFKISKPAVSTAGDDYINLVELQIWIKDGIDGIKNIAPLFTKIDGYDGPTYTWGPPKAIINEEIDTSVSGSYWHSDLISNLDFGESYAHYTTNTSYNAQDIVAIVIYNRPTNNNRLPGIKFDLMSEHNTLYSYTFVDQESVTRLDGPAISSVDVSYFSSSDSTTLIKNITAKETMEFALSELDPIVHIKLKTGPSTYDGSPATVYINIYTSNDIKIGTSHEFFTNIAEDELKTNSIRLPKLYNNIKVELFMTNNDGLFIEKLEIFYIGNIHQFTQIDGSNPNSLGFGVNNTVGWLDNDEGKPNSRKYTGINYYDILQNFNIIRVLRTTNGADAGNTGTHSDDNKNRLQCTELQLWVKDFNSNIINIAPNGTPYADLAHTGGYSISNINNETINTDGQNTYMSSHTTANGGIPVVCTHHFKITLDNYYNINNVAAIVYYSVNGPTYPRTPGASIQLLHDDTLLYTHEIGSEGNLTNTPIFKIHGPALPSNYNFANSWSTSSIIKTTNISSSTPYLLLDTISTRNNFSSTLLARIKKVRVRRVQDQPFTPSSNNDNNMGIAEIQFWVNGINVAQNGSVTASSEYSTEFAATNVLGGTFALLGGESWLGDLPVSSYDFITVTLPSDYNVYDIQSVVVYGPVHPYAESDQHWQTARDDLIKGCVIELLDASDNILYENEVFHGARYNRFDGPSLNTATFSTTPSTTSIIGNTGNLRTYTILNNSNYINAVKDTVVEEDTVEQTSIVDPSYSIIYNPDTNEATYTKYFDIKIDSLHTELQSNINNISLLEVEFETLTNSFNIIDTSFNLRKTNDDISLNINDVSLNVFETRYINLDTSFNNLDSSFNLQKPNVDAILNIHDISLNILEPTPHDIDLNINKFDVSFNELVSQGGLVYNAPFSIGSGSTSSGINSFALGPNASTGSNDNSVAIGNGTIGTENNIVLGGSTQSVIMNNLNIGDISFGDVGYGADWSGIQNRNDSEYALIQKNTGETLINSHDDSIIFRIDNANYMYFESTWGLYCSRQINSPEQPLWVINSTTAGNQNYGQGGRIGSSVNLGGQSLSHYFNNISKWNTTDDGWDHASGAFFAPEDGIYLVDLYIFCNNATTFDGRCKWSTNAGRNQNGQYNFDVTRDTVNEGCDLHRMTWYATAGKYIFWYVSTTYGPNNIPLTCFLNNGGHTCLRITKIL